MCQYVVYLKLAICLQSSQKAYDYTQDLRNAFLVPFLNSCTCQPHKEKFPVFRNCSVHEVRPILYIRANSKTHSFGSDFLLLP